MRRCFDLAKLGAGQVSPNPLVGAVIEYQGRVIGEGYHARYGQAHAEVQAVASVVPEDLPLLSQATLYVSLEPCCIHGRTPPCTDLIQREGIPRVMASVVDQTPEVSGKGLEILSSHGIHTEAGLLASEGESLSRIRNFFVTHGRPYVMLKYAQTRTGKMGHPHQPVWLTNPVSQRLAHKWRSETDAILVGTQTALIDNPQLTNRLYFGKSPVRIALDRQGRLPHHLRLFDQEAPTWVVTENPAHYQDLPQVQTLEISFGPGFWNRLLALLGEKRITSLMVEGGRQVLDSLIEAGAWEEARVFHTPGDIPQGIAAPILTGKETAHYRLLDDELFVIFRR